MVAGDTNNLPIQVHIVHTKNKDDFWTNLLKKSLIFCMLYHFIIQCLKNVLLYSVETVLQSYFNGYVVAPTVVVGAFLITGFWPAVTSLV